MTGSEEEKTHDEMLDLWLMRFSGWPIQDICKGCANGSAERFGLVFVNAPPHGEQNCLVEMLQFGLLFTSCHGNNQRESNFEQFAVAADRAQICWFFLFFFDRQFHFCLFILGLWIWTTPLHSFTTRRKTNICNCPKCSGQAGSAHIKPNSWFGRLAVKSSDDLAS